MDIKTLSHSVGETLAKLYFELQGYFTYTNSTGKSEFDLIISKEGIIKTVEVKTVSVPKTSEKGTYYSCILKSVRSNKTTNTVYHFDNSKMDILAVVNLTNNTIAIFDAKEITVKAELRIYEEKFIRVV